MKFPKKLVINQKQTDIGYLDDMGLFEPIYTKKLANEVIRRWNSQPDLEKACKRARDWITDQTTLDMIDVALAKAKPK